MIKVFEMFAGYGGASFGLKKVGIPHEVIGYSEIDKYAIQCFNQNHKREVFSDETDEEEFNYEEIKNYGDCTKINPKELPDFDLLTGGFPCQSFSIAGRGLGELDTRGTLFFDIVRIAEVKKPKYMLLENVKGLTFKKHHETFKKILNELGRIGYNVYWKVLNSKDYGVPQNRERIFFVCFRKDLEFNFTFPKEEKLKILLRDILEEEVDEKFYLTKEQTERLIKKSRSFNERFCKTYFSPTLCARDYKDSKVIPVLTPDRLNKRQNGRKFKEDDEPMFTLNTQDRHGILQINNPIHSKNRIYSQEGISPTINTMQGGNLQPFILTGLQEHQSIKTDGISNALPSAMGMGGGHTPIVMNTITEAFGRGGSSSEHIKMVENILGSNGSIRKLTPKECFRLMGFLNDEINLEGLSNTQQYKLAGNGWDINLVSKIFEKMFSSPKSSFKNRPKHI